MSNRWMAPLFLLSWTMLAMSCVPSKKDCTDNYTVKDLFTEEQCDAAYPDPKPVPGPKIILKKDGAGSYQTYADYGAGDVLQTPGTKTAWETGTIRKDFVGTKINALTVWSTPTTYIANANYVVFEKTIDLDKYRIELIRTAGDKARWYASKNGANRKQLTPVDVDPAKPNEVPVEFSGFDASSLFEVVEGVTIDRVDYYRVNM